MSLRDLYQEMIVDHGRHPRNFGTLPDASHSRAGHNPLCGDKLTVYLIERQGIVEEVRFEGTGCAISVASASLMTGAIKGKRVTEIEALFQQFHVLVTEGKEADESIGKLVALAGVAEFPVRVKCATLAWHTLMAALSNQSGSVSTE